MRDRVLTMTVRRLSRILPLGFLVTVSCAERQDAASAWTTDTIHSRIVGPRAIHVATPAGYEQDSADYPVLLLLDADDTAMFQLWLAQSAYLAQNSAGVPQMIVVGVPNGDDRIHDLTPPPTGSSARTFRTAGGAAAFADFIIDEILPHVRAKYRARPAVVVAGHSVAGLFALDAAAKRPGSFQGIIAMDPSLQFNDASLIGPYVELMARSRGATRIFVSSRDGDEVLPRACRLFAARMEQMGALTGNFTYRVYAGATHELVPLSFADGLAFIFEPMAPDRLAIRQLDLATVDSAGLQEALRSSDSAYASAARSLGLSESLPEEVLNDLGYELMEHDRTVLAIAVFEANVRRYPNSANAHDSLGDGFVAAGDTASAITAYRRALEIARRGGVPANPETEQKLDALAR